MHGDSEATLPREIGRFSRAVSRSNTRRVLMAIYEASVKKALTSSQRDLIDHKEHCSAAPEKLYTVGRALGHQVRIKRNDSEYGLYTVSQVHQENPDDIIRMG